MDWGAIILTLIMDFIFTVFFYLLVPVIFCIRNKPMSKKQINRVIWINAAIIWFVFRIIAIAVDGESGTGAAVFLWSWVGKKIMERVLLIKDEADKTKKVEQNNDSKGKELTTSTTPEGVTHICFSDANDISERKSGMTYSRDIVLQSNATTADVKKAYYCRKCGNKLHDDSVYCDQCGTQVICEPYYPKLPPLKEPRNGEVLSGMEYKRCSKITITAQENVSYLVKLKNAFGDERLSFYVRAGKTVTLGVPNEDMYVYFASGDKWYGTEYLFGVDTKYTKDEEIKEFSNSGWEYDLSPLNDGSFQATTIAPEEFK